MRKVSLRMNEEYKYKIIKKLVEKSGNKKRASVKLNCSIRTVNRLIQKHCIFKHIYFVWLFKSILSSQISINFSS